MSRPGFISSLPESLSIELRKRLLLNGFSGYEELAEWLTFEGYPASKSAIHRYAQDHRFSILLDHDNGLYGTLTIHRLAALECASKFAASEDELIAMADRLLAWIQDV